MIVRSDSEMAGYNDIQQFSGHKVMGQKNTNYDTIIDQIKGVSHETPKATYPELVVALQMVIPMELRLNYQLPTELSVQTKD